jgi:hypothetical protein
MICSVVFRVFFMEDCPFDNGKSSHFQWLKFRGPWQRMKDAALALSDAFA